MHHVTIKIQDGSGPLARVTEVSVSNTSKAAALAGALAAVMPQVRLEWAALIRAARAVQAATTPNPARVPPSGRGASAASPLAGLAASLSAIQLRPIRPPSVDPEVARATGAALARVLLRMHSALADAASRLSGHAPARPELRPVDPETRWASVLVLPVEARDWNSQGRTPVLHPGTVAMPPEYAAAFHAWRASRALPPTEVPSPASDPGPDAPAAEGPTGSPTAEPTEEERPGST